LGATGLPSPNGRGLTSNQEAVGESRNVLEAANGADPKPTCRAGLGQIRASRVNFPKPPEEIGRPMPKIRRSPKHSENVGAGSFFYLVSGGGQMVGDWAGVFAVPWVPGDGVSWLISVCHQ
jgi:hypothetical protein